MIDQGPLERGHLNCDANLRRNINTSGNENSLSRHADNPPLFQHLLVARSGRIIFIFNNNTPMEHGKKWYFVTSDTRPNFTCCENFLGVIIATLSASVTYVDVLFIIAMKFAKQTQSANSLDMK